MLSLLGVLAGCAAIAFTAMAYRRRWQWTGLPADPGSGTDPPRPAKTLWDWLQLLVIPFVLALAAFALNVTQADRDRKREERREARNRAIAADRAREDTLRAYLQQMSDLITDHRLRAQNLDPGSPASDASTLARTLTLIALRRLDRERKSLVLQFLSEARLIEGKITWLYRTPEGIRLSPPFVVASTGGRVSLEDADLRGVVFRGPSNEWRASRGEIVVSSTNLDGADLRGARFRGRLVGLSLQGADLRDADFRGASLGGAVFESACLSGARIERASVHISGAPPSLAFAGADFEHAEGSDVSFSRTRLDHADFRDARLTRVNLRGATTTGTRWPTGWSDRGTRAGVVADDPRLCADFP